MISFSGLITFKKYEGHELIRAVPGDQILVETDSPYLAPVPYRGKRNEPAFVRDTATEVARVRGVDLQTISTMTTANALRFYGLRAESPTIAQAESVG
jgi:TatD DNase family protein